VFGQVKSYFKEYTLKSMKKEHFTTDIDEKDYFKFLDKTFSFRFTVSGTVVGSEQKWLEEYVVSWKSLFFFYLSLPALCVDRDLSLCSDFSISVGNLPSSQGLVPRFWPRRTE